MNNNPEHVPPFHPVPFVAALVLVALIFTGLFGFSASRAQTLPADATVTPRIDTSKLFITESSRYAFTIQTYNRMMIGTWFEMKNPETTGDAVTMQDIGFPPEKVVVTVKNEPIVVAKDNGTWEITFKEKAP